MSVSTDYFVSDAVPWITALVPARTRDGNRATPHRHAQTSHSSSVHFPTLPALTVDAALQEPSLTVVVVEVIAAACEVIVSSSTSRSPSVFRSGSTTLRAPRRSSSKSNGNISCSVCMV